MPFHLDRYIGGLGNQLFQVITIISLAEKYDTTFSIPLNIDYIYGLTGIIPVYLKNIFLEFTKHKRYKVFDSTLQSIRININQFADINLDNRIDKKETQIILDGLPMWLPLIDISIAQELLLSAKNNTSYSLSNNNITKLCVCFRSFDEENRNDWMISIEYYKLAFQYIIPKLNSPYELHIFTDRENIKNTIIIPLLNELNIIDLPEIYEYTGKRDGVTDVEHFYKMIDCNHFILCNSTYHYWAAIINDNPDAIITYPNKIENGINNDWFKIISPSKWTKIDYFRS